MPLPNYCAWCGRHANLPYAAGGRPVLCQSCIDGWITVKTLRPAGREIVLDACCGQGGAARGYANAGHYVVGIDSDPDCRKGYLRSGAAEFICGDALKYLANGKFLDRFTFIHFSPPCQWASAMLNCQPPEVRARYKNLITPGRPLLNRAYLPYVIENVGAARPWLRDPVTLCMWMFGRATYRHRLIEAGGGFSLQPPPVPDWAWEPPSGDHVRARRVRLNRECGWPHPVPTSKAGHWKPGYFVSVAGHERKEPVRAAMEIDETWMPDREAVAEAIPHYLTAYIADQLSAWRLAQAA